MSRLRRIIQAGNRLDRWIVSRLFLGCVIVALFLIVVNVLIWSVFGLLLGIHFNF